MHVVSVDCPGPPVNDDCANALPIPCGSTVSGSTTLATLDGPATSCTGGSVAARCMVYLYRNRSGFYCFTLRTRH